MEPDEGLSQAERRLAHRARGEARAARDHRPLASAHTALLALFEFVTPAPRRRAFGLNRAMPHPRHYSSPAHALLADRTGANTSEQSHRCHASPQNPGADGTLKEQRRENVVIKEAAV